MEYISVKEAAEKWGYSEATVRKWCKSGTVCVIVGAKKESGHWLVPALAECPKKCKKNN